MKIIRRYLPTRRDLWQQSSLEEECTSPVGVVRALNEFQQMLMDSGFSFHNILRLPAAFAPLLRTRRVPTCGHHFGDSTAANDPRVEALGGYHSYADKGGSS